MTTPAATATSMLDGAVDLGDGAWILHVPRWLPDHQGVMHRVLDEVEVAPQQMEIWGRLHVTSRLMRSAGVAYDYGRARLCAASWTPTLLSVRAAVERELGFAPNECLVSYYPTGDANVGHHRDPGTVAGSPIVSVSLGAHRTFVMRHAETRETRTWQLGGGDLFVMGGECGQSWTHAVPRQAGARARVSLTFRRLVATRS